MAIIIALAALNASGFAQADALPPPAARAIDYNRDVRPILATNCYKCHGPQQQKGGLRLDRKATALRGGESGAAIVPGKSAESLLIRNVSRLPDALPMPLQGEPLTSEQVGILRAWIDQGAAWPVGDAAEEVHWAFKPLESPPLPDVKNPAWPRNEIDRFVLAKMEERGLAPSEEADRRTLIRRLTFNLHGLPPTPEEIAAFLNDDAPHAYERLVDRLLGSPRYGERWGRHWLDVVHYAETHGFDKDKRRDNAWPYRDYVIRSFNEDKPYSQFVREQIAGDVLYPFDPDGIVATGFLAAGPWDFVGHTELREGTMEKERVRSLDRDDFVATTMSTFTSMTVHCARCHDHKFDPIPQKDYYALQAVFAGIDRGNRSYESAENARKREQLLAAYADGKARQAGVFATLAALEDPKLIEIDKEREVTKQKLENLGKKGREASPSNGWHSEISSVQETEKWVQVDLGAETEIQSIVLIPARPTDFPDTPGFGFPIRFKVSISNEESFANSTLVLDRLGEDVSNPGDEALRIDDVKGSARFVRVTATKLWQRTSDYAFALGELQVYSEGENVALSASVSSLDSIEAGRWSQRFLVDDFDSRKPLRAKALVHNDDEEIERYGLQQKLKDLDFSTRVRISELFDERTVQILLGELVIGESYMVRSKDLQDQLPKPQNVYASVPIEPRPVHLLNRGNVDAPVEPALPGALSAVPNLDCKFEVQDNSEGARRAALAEWITDRDNFLTWRSIVNRVWHYHFGRGIVDTPNDFGHNGSLPSHPELLGWLASEFIESGGSFKSLHRLILTSATYRQVSSGNPEFEKIDADNRLLWRMNRRKLDAESIRDAVLAASGRLDLTMGGPSFETFRFKDDHSPRFDYDVRNDPKLWRRSVYRFIVRSVPDPFMVSLDCADANISTPVRSETLTALQALALMNDAFMLDQAKAFAARVEKIGGDRDEQIRTAFELAISREPSPEESTMLSEYANEHGMANACRLIFNMNEFIFLD